jgi:hypothetical protein
MKAAQLINDQRYYGFAFWRGDGFLHRKLDRGQIVFTGLHDDGVHDGLQQSAPNYQ